MTEKLCLGVRCSIRGVCLLYTKGLRLSEEDVKEVKFFRTCTNQKKFVRDESKKFKTT